jgi:hypothetical protein
MNRPRAGLVYCAFALALTLGSTVSLHAVDGVLEINQTCAVAGCFTGDTPGFPVRIESPGSYRLTSDLVVTHGGAVTIYTDFVTLDLNGFSVRCDRSVGNCQEVVGSGIFSQGNDAEVRNGAVSGFGLHGVSLDDRSRIRNLRIYENAGAGLFIRGSSLVTNSIISTNGQQGIKSFDETSLIIDNVITNNGGYGISGSSATSYKGNVLQGNNASGNQVLNATEIDQNMCGFNTTCP